MQSAYMNSNVIKYIRPKLFYAHELQVNGEISILQIKLCNNVTYLFTKSLLYTTFSKYVANIGICRLRDLQELGGIHHEAIRHISITLYFFPMPV
jgi:hypothetical protein